MKIFATLIIIRYNKIIKTRLWFHRLWLFYFCVVIKKYGYSFFGLWILSPSTGHKVLAFNCTMDGLYLLYLMFFKADSFKYGEVP